MGVVKKYDNKLKVAWVVYSCAGDWLNYQNYTAEATGYADLTRDLDTKEG